MAQEIDQFKDVIDITEIIHAEEIQVALFCHGNFCRVPLTTFLNFMETHLSCLGKIMK